jgi:hypothetical protein
VRMYYVILIDDVKGDTKVDIVFSKQNSRLL